MYSNDLYVSISICLHLLGPALIEGSYIAGTGFGNVRPSLLRYDG